jgi:hypothetical protein
MEILRNQIGKKGILIEYDAGYISPKDNKHFINEVNKLNVGEPIIEDPLVVFAVLQKYGIENKNERVYPEHLLKRETQNYLKLVKDNRALGECVPKGTEIYTTSGWKNIEDVNVGETILTLNIEKDILEEQVVSNTIKKHYQDDLIHIYNKNSLDMKITKKHKVVLWDRNDKPYILTGEELYEKLENKDEVIFNSYIKNSHLSEIEITYLTEDTISFNKIPHNDDVYCVTVPNSTWLMKSDNKTSWTHNCDHPESSIIAVSRISHNIIDLWWEGNVLMGKLEIIMSPGFVNQGIISCEGDRVANYLRKGLKIGVSSRGVGSLEKVNGKNIVQDDFELICWDIVTSPSTPGSWIYTEQPTPEQQKLTESTDKGSNLLLDSLNNFLLF